MSVRVAAPAPEFAILGARPRPEAATPTLGFDLEVREPGGADVYTIALAALVTVEPSRRSYDEETRARLVDLFGEPGRWPATTGQSLVWGRVDLLVPSFSGRVVTELLLPCSADLELAVARYMASLSGATVPLTFRFSGTVFYRGDGDRLQLVQVPWSGEARYRLPVKTWRDLVERHHLGTGFVRVTPETLDRLRAYRVERGHPSFDACIAELLPE